MEFACGLEFSMSSDDRRRYFASPPFWRAERSRWLRRWHPDKAVFASSLLLTLWLTDDSYSSLCLVGSSKTRRCQSCRLLTVAFRDIPWESHATQKLSGSAQPLPNTPLREKLSEDVSHQLIKQRAQVGLKNQRLFACDCCCQTDFNS